MNVASDGLAAHAHGAQGVGDLLDADAADRGAGITPADDDRRDVEHEPVEQAGVDERAHDLAASLDHQRQVAVRGDPAQTRVQVEAPLGIGGHLDDADAPPCQRLGPRTRRALGSVVGAAATSSTAAPSGTARRASST